jgi:hypothetical protein
MYSERKTASVVKWLALKTTNTEVPCSIPGHSLGFFWGSWVWNGVHSASWSDKLSSYMNKEVTSRLESWKMQLWDLMCWPHVNPVPSGAVGKDCQRRLLNRPRFIRACSATDYLVEAMGLVFSPLFSRQVLRFWSLSRLGKKSMDLSPYRKLIVCEEIYRLLRNKNARYFVHNNPLLFRILFRFNPILVLPHDFSKIYFNNILSLCLDISR